MLKTTGSGCEAERSSVWSLIVFPHKAGEKLRQRNFARWQLITQHLVLLFLLQTARGKAVHKVSHGFEDLGYFFYKNRVQFTLAFEVTTPSIKYLVKLPEKL